MNKSKENIDALRRLLTYASHEAEAIENDKLSDIIRHAIKEIDLYTLHWHDDAISVLDAKKRQII